MTLNECFNKFGSDKGDVHHEAHGYSGVYESLLKDFDPLRLLEIGVWDPRFRGGSARAWRAWRPEAKLFGLDINPDAAVLAAELGMNVFIADQNDMRQLEGVRNEMGEVDAIIDDGSHFLPHVITSLLCLWPAVKKGGLYIIEDLHAPHAQPRHKLDELAVELGAESSSWDVGEKLLILRK